MPLQQLVSYFNDRFEKVHHSNLHPFRVNEDLVTGIFGPISISSAYLAIRTRLDHTVVTGHIAQLLAAPVANEVMTAQAMELGALVTDAVTEPVNFQAIINIDRLCRTVHMLNYLPLSHLGGVLFLDVDPRHILSVKQDHGVYFEEIIIKCGLTTKNIAISLTIDNFYALNHEQLLAGLSNYRQRGYQIALNIGHFYNAKGLVEFVTALSPDYIRVSAPRYEENSADYEVFESISLKSLESLFALATGQAILQSVDKQEQALIADTLSCDLVQGIYYDKLATDYLRCL
jgi:EAL domain-containing protein (putative c-di-GMP-specific phosphodiesterase class I)